MEKKTYYFAMTEYNYGHIKVEATSQEEAERLAQALLEDGCYEINDQESSVELGEVIPD